MNIIKYNNKKNDKIIKYILHPITITMKIAKLYGIRKDLNEEATWCQLSIDSQPNAISFLTPNNVGKKTREEMLIHIQ